MSPIPNVPDILRRVAAGTLSVDQAAEILQPSNPMAEMPYREIRDEILQSRSASFWLQGAIRDLEDHDALDALCDAHTLTRLLARRLAKTQ